MLPDILMAGGGRGVRVAENAPMQTLDLSRLSPASASNFSLVVRGGVELARENGPKGGCGFLHRFGDVLIYKSYG